MARGGGYAGDLGAPEEPMEQTRHNEREASMTGILRLIRSG